MSITGKVTRVVNNWDTSSVQLSPAWIDGKPNHVVHLDIIEKITPMNASNSQPIALDQMMQNMEIDTRNEMLPSISFPLEQKRDENPFSSRAVKRSRPFFLHSQFKKAMTTIFP